MFFFWFSLKWVYVMFRNDMWYVKCKYIWLVVVMLIMIGVFLYIIVYLKLVGIFILLLLFNK